MWYNVSIKKGDYLSIIDYKYQHATHAQLLKCVRWCQNQLQLRDWLIELSTELTPPKCLLTEATVLNNYGTVDVSEDKLKAVIWINLVKIKVDNQNPYSTTIHEMVHVLLMARGNDAPEIIIRVIEPMLYRLYCRENNLKIMEECL